MVQTIKASMERVKELFVPMPLLYLSIFAFSIGAAILIGKEERFSSVSYSGARGFAPWYVWGIGLVVYSVALLVLRNSKVNWLVILSGGVIWLFYAIGFMTAAAENSTVGYSGATLFFIFWIIHTHCAVIELMSHFRHKIEEKAVNDARSLDYRIQRDSSGT